MHLDYTRDKLMGVFLGFTLKNTVYCLVQYLDKMLEKTNDVDLKRQGPVCEDLCCKNGRNWRS